MKIATLSLFCICSYLAAVAALPQIEIGSSGRRLKAFLDESLEDGDELIKENNDISEENDEDDFAVPQTLSRKKRQSVNNAMNLASNPNNHPVGRPFGQFDLNGSGNNMRNYNAQAGVGVGADIWRSQNDRHRIGAGAYAGQNFGRYEGFRYKSKPDVGVGLGYRFRF